MTLKVVGMIEPAPYKDPATMLRNIAEDIERGDFGEVRSVAVAMFGENGLDVFGGGIDSLNPTLVTLFQAGSMYLCRELVDSGDFG